jgi:hypothetical protein
MRSKKIIDKSLTLANKIYRQQIIKNSELPLCQNCFYFYPVSKNTNLEENNDIIFEQSKCLKYGIRNIVSGEISYESAHNMRQSELKCGLGGKSFEEK